MATNPAATNGNANGTDEDEKKRPAPVGLAPGPTCPNATNVNNATGAATATATAAAACNRADCVVCTTINLHSPYLAETPDRAVGEFWIRHIDSVFGMRTERQAEEMRSCMETGDRVLDMARCFVEQQVQILREMRQINRSLDETLERIGAVDPDDEDDVLHNPEVDHTIIHALALLRHGGPMDGEDTQQ